MSKNMNIAAGIVSLALVAGGFAAVTGLGNLRNDAPVHKVDASKSYTAKNFSNPAIGDAEGDKVQRDAEAARVAAEQEAARQAEAARIAAEQAAQVEAQRQAASQSARSVSNAPTTTEAPSVPAGLTSGTVIPQPNGYPDTTQCASGTGTTNDQGVPVCA